MSRFVPLLLLPFLLGAHQAAEAPLPDIKFPAEVVAANGKKINVAKLAKNQRVVVVTLKATSTVLKKTTKPKSGTRSGSSPTV